jgi:hypothetical protein
MKCSDQPDLSTAAGRRKLAEICEAAKILSRRRATWNFLRDERDECVDALPQAIRLLDEKDATIKQLLAESEIDFNDCEDQLTEKDRIIEGLVAMLHEQWIARDVTLHVKISESLDIEPEWIALARERAEKGGSRRLFA